MNNIPPINTATPTPNVPAAQENAQVTATGKDTPLADRVEISELAQLANKLDIDMNNIRLEKVLTIREEIANGTYLTPDKIEATANKLLEVLRTPQRV